MMMPEQVEELIKTGMPECQEVKVQGDGSHFDAVVVSSAFAGQSPVKRHQMVNAAVGAQFASGELHALSIKPYTPEEWQAQQGGAGA